MGRKDAARGLALASLLRQVAVSELLPRLHARLGVSSVVELSELDADDFDGLQVVKSSFPTAARYGLIFLNIYIYIRDNYMCCS